MPPPAAATLLPIELPPPPPLTPVASLADPLDAPPPLDEPPTESVPSAIDDPPLEDPDAPRIIPPIAELLLPEIETSSPIKSAVDTLPAMATRGPMRFTTAAAEIKTANSKNAYSGIDAPR
jgi:hypothetical protein